MPRNGSQWTTITLSPLTGPLDARSRPANLLPGAFRKKLNMQVTPEGKLNRRQGFAKAWYDKLYDDLGVPLTDPAAGSGSHYHNHDHHAQAATREPITFMYECTWGDKTREFFDGTQSRISLLDEDAGTYTDLATGKGAYGSYWNAAFLQDTVIFTNDVDNVLAYPKGGPIAEIPDLRDNVKCTAAKIAIEYQGVVLLMNTVEDMNDGKGPRRFVSRVRWCDLNLPLVWNSVAPSIAAYMDLDYGDEILGAALMLGSVYIYTRRKIWRCTVSGDPATMFNFQTVYSEPKNQSGCLAYPRTLVSTGSSHRYVSRDGIYTFSPYVAEPQRDDWLHLASGVMFTDLSTAMTGVLCNLPCAEYLPTTKEIWFSWPSGSNTVNNYTLVAQLDHKTADLVDAGFTAFCNYRRLPLADILCNEVQSFLGASGFDYCIKSIGGGVFYREYVSLIGGDPTVDIVLDDAVYYDEGYYSELRGMIPLGYVDREKIVRLASLDDDVIEEVNPPNYRMWLGNSFNVADPNDSDNVCGVLWRSLGTHPVACIDGNTVSSLQAQKLKPAVGKDWPAYESNRYLYFRLRIEGTDGGLPVGADTALNSLSFDVLAMPRP